MLNTLVNIGYKWKMIALNMQLFILNIVVLQYFFFFWLLVWWVKYLLPSMMETVFKNKWLIWWNISWLLQLSTKSEICKHVEFLSLFSNAFEISRSFSISFTQVTSIKGYILLSINDSFCYKFCFTLSSVLSTESQG